jgi:hypothetical protein
VPVRPTAVALQGPYTASQLLKLFDMGVMTMSHTVVLEMSAGHQEDVMMAPAALLPLLRTPAIPSVPEGCADLRSAGANVSIARRLPPLANEQQARLHERARAAKRTSWGTGDAVYDVRHAQPPSKHTRHSAVLRRTDGIDRWNGAGGPRRSALCSTSTLSPSHEQDELPWQRGPATRSPAGLHSSLLLQHSPCLLHVQSYHRKGRRDFQRCDSCSR